MTQFGTVEEWREELQALTTCRDDIKEGISKAYSDMKVKTFLNELIRKHGLERVTTTLSATVRLSSNDTRYDRSVIKWALRNGNSFPSAPGYPESIRVNEQLAVNAHPAMLNSMAKLAMQMETVRSTTKRLTLQPER